MKNSSTTVNNRCECTIIHEDIVVAVRAAMPQAEKLLAAANFFRLFGDGTRLRILAALSTSEMCGCDLAAILNTTQSAVSHQLRLLKQARLVQSRREGKIIYFSLDDDHIHEILRIGIHHVSE